MVNINKQSMHAYNQQSTTTGDTLKRFCKFVSKISELNLLLEYR